MKAYKGFNKDMTCRGFQFEEGKEYETDRAELCEEGFHACENPLDCFGYYRPGQSVFHEVDIVDNGQRNEDDTKVVGKKIKIGARLSVGDICRAHFEFVKSCTTTNKQGEDNANISAQDGSSLSARNWSSLSAQDGSSLSARNWSSLSARNWSSLSAQNDSSLSAGRNSVIAAFNSKAKAGLGSLIALANRKFMNGQYIIADFKAAVVDGEIIKADTWYKLENGEFVEAE